MAEVEGQVRDEELDAEREARRQLALAQIRQYPDPVLRMEAPPVEQFDDDLKRLVARMGELMKDANGVGLAATQVGVLRRVFVFVPEGDTVAVLVNPEIVRRGDEAETDDEGCLSIQGVTMPVVRSTSTVATIPLREPMQFGAERRSRARTARRDGRSASIPGAGSRDSHPE